MRDFLLYLAQNIVDKPEAVEVVEKINPQDNSVLLEMRVDPSDMGKIIGKSGRIIKALRDLIRILAIKQNTRVTLTLLES